jgi:PleD family two-component response regulator
MKDAVSTIQIVDDDPAMVMLLKKHLTTAGYDVVTASRGAEALDRARENAPDLFLLDVDMPELDGLEVCRRLKQDPRLCQVPVIFITAQDTAEDVVAGFEAGGEDYIKKPFNKSEVLARVRTHIKLYRSLLELERLNQIAFDANPSTGLPGNNSINEAIARALAERRPLCVIYSDLDNFKSYNDKYGFARGDRAIRFTADMLRRSVDTVCGPGCFLGHIGGDDFTVLVPSGRARAVAEEIIRRFDAGVKDLYDPADLTAGGIEAADRQGMRRYFPIMTISLAVVDLAARTFSHYLEVSNTCAEVKKAAKAMPGSSCYFDSRKGPPAGKSDREV